MAFGPRRGEFINAADRVFEDGWPLDEATVEQCEAFDLVYRTLCAVMYNYVPLSGHPGGSISSGRFVERLLFDAMDYDLVQPTARMPTSFPTQPGTRRSAFTRCGRCATKWRGSQRRIRCRATRNSSFDSKISLGFAAIRQRHAAV